MKYMNKLTLGIVLAAGLFTACSDKDDVRSEERRVGKECTG